MLFVCVVSSDNDVFQDPGHCFAEPQNQVGLQGRQPAQSCSSSVREMCPQGQRRASEQEEGHGNPVTGVELEWKGPHLEPSTSTEAGQGMSAVPDCNSPFLSHCRWDRPGVFRDHPGPGQPSPREFFPP